MPGPQVIVEFAGWTTSNNDDATITAVNTDHGGHQLRGGFVYGSPLPTPPPPMVFTYISSGIARRVRRSINLR